MKKTCLIFLSLIFSIQMNAQVTAAFIYADLKDTVICDTAPMVEVMDQSTGGVTSWLWEIWDQQWTFVSDKIRIDLGAWPGGVYLLSVMGSNSTGRMIFIKN